LVVSPLKIRILEISSCFPPSRGGVEKFVHSLTSGLAQKGHLIKVITSTRGLEPKFKRHFSDTIELIRIPEKFHLFEAPFIPRVAVSALTEDYDVLHINGMVPLVSDLAILFARLRGKPVVLTYHNDAETATWGALGGFAAAVYSVVARFFVSFADVIVCSTRSYAMTSPVIRFFHHKLRVIPLGVDLARFSAAALVSPVEKKDDKKRLLFVGQLKQYKGVHVLVESLAHLRRQGHSVELGIVGTGPEYEKIRSRVNELGLRDHVTFRGNVGEEELPSLYAQSDLLVLPSLGRREAFGIVLLEALAAGKPVVATDTPGVGEVALKVGGFVSKRNDPHSLAESIISALSSEDRQDDYRKKAEPYSSQAMIDSYHSLLTSMTAPR
jgi:glycosyltransferase involved in cell wall biosynthesis